MAGDAGAGAPTPNFAVTSAGGMSGPTPLDVTFTQLQYSQTVLLNFSGLTWPHVSVATLVPHEPVPVTI